jgi:hypothetical protein
MGIAMAMKVERNLCSRLVRNNTFYQMTNVDRRIKDIAHRINPGPFMHIIGRILIDGCTPVFKVFFFAYKRVRAVADESESLMWHRSNMIVLLLTHLINHHHHGSARSRMRRLL